MAAYRACNKDMRTDLIRSNFRDTVNAETEAREALESVSII
jgi:hypothetical protein